VLDQKEERIAVEFFYEITQPCLNLEGTPKYILQQHLKTQQ
jgi:hypothetical protein